VAARRARAARPDLELETTQLHRPRPRRRLRRHLHEPTVDLRARKQDEPQHRAAPVEGRARGPADLPQGTAPADARARGAALTSVSARLEVPAHRRHGRLPVRLRTRVVVEVPAAARDGAGRALAARLEPRLDPGGRVVADRLLRISGGARREGPAPRRRRSLHLVEPGGPARHVAARAAPDDAAPRGRRPPLRRRVVRERRPPVRRARDAEDDRQGSEGRAPRADRRCPRDAG
jgi:hypothetical protein